MLEDDDMKDINPEENIEDEVVKPDETTVKETAFEPEKISHPAEHEDDKTVTVQPVQFASFEDLDQVQGPQNQNLNILLDVKLQLSVELGKAELPIKKVLELTKADLIRKGIDMMYEKARTQTEQSEQTNNS